MFKNYLLVAFRNLFKNRIYALINILGLGLSLAICIVAYFNYMFAYNFDRGHENFEEIYRVNSFRDMQGRNQEYGLTPLSLGMEIKNKIPGINEAARVLRSYSPIRTEHDIFNKRVWYIDPEFLDIFTFPLIAGNKEAIKKPGNILVSQKLANVLFGKEDPIGKQVSIFNDANKEFVFTIAGIFKDIPLNSSFRIDIFTNIDNFIQMFNRNETDWKAFSNGLFIRVNNPGRLKQIKELLERYNEVQNKARPDFLITGYNLVPLKDVGDNTREIWSNNLYPGMHPAAVIAPPIMAFLILLIATFNFANTTISTVGKRLKEIGLRKVLGGQRKQLMVQFLFENILVTLLALWVAIGLAIFLVPAYSSMWEFVDMKFSFTEYLNFWIFLLLLLVTTALLAGMYPALYISSFRPIEILHVKTRLGNAGTLSQIFLFFQFAISVIALASGFIFMKNARYQETLDLGYDRDRLIAIPIQSRVFNTYREALGKNPKILATAGTEEHIGFGNYRRPIKDENQQIEVDVMDIGPGYARTMGLRLFDGRFFDQDREEADRGKSIIVNQKLVNDFGWKNPLGKTVTMYDTLSLKVIGIVEDYYTRGLYNEIEPSIIRLSTREQYYNLVVRSNPEDLKEVLDYCREEWINLVPGSPFEGMYQEDTLEDEKTINKSIKQLFVFLAIVAIILSLIGLYTLVSLSITARTKEIGIRKVLGSNISPIIVLLSRRFLVLLVFSSVFGAISANYLSKILLGSIWKYYLQITPGLLIWSVLLMISVAVLTISSLVYHAAIQNPVKSLRYE